MRVRFLFLMLEPSELLVRMWLATRPKTAHQRISVGFHGFQIEHINE